MKGWFDSCWREIWLRSWREGRLWRNRASLFHNCMPGDVHAWLGRTVGKIKCRLGFHSWIERRGLRSGFLDGFCQWDECRYCRKER